MAFIPWHETPMAGLESGITDELLDELHLMNALLPDR